MHLSLKKIFNSTLMLKCIAVLIGYVTWHHISSHQLVRSTYTIPVCFYGKQKDIIYKAPETIEVTLQAKRFDLSTIDTEQLAVHVNSNGLQVGANTIVIDNSTLFLPAHINVLHYKPSNITVLVEQSKTEVL